MKPLTQEEIQKGFVLLNLDTDQKRQKLSPGIEKLKPATKDQPAFQPPIISKETKSLIETL